MATSNDTRVRVEGLSKIIASVLPASGALSTPRVRAAFMARLSSIIPASTGFGMSIRSRKCRTPLPVMTPPPSAGRGCALASRAQARSMRATASAISASPMISGGNSRTTLSPAATVSIFSARRRRPSRTAGGTMRRPISRPSPRTSAITAGMAVLDLGEPLLEQQAHLAHMLEEARRQHHVEHGVADRHGERIAAEGRAVRARRSCPWPASAVARQAPTGKPPPSALATAMMSGVDAGALIGEQVAGAADAGLHLVEDQQQAVLVAQLAQAAQEARRRHAHAALALDRLDQDGARSAGRSPS